ncbi:MAG: UDP-2,4-diacetamido-2,4,6-trideoxy-beta-L-altropyranose hydrolase, partial [Nevskiales bacterium]
AHDCDVLLDQNLHLNAGQRYQIRVPATCRRLLGARYALLRQEFAQLRQTLRERDGRFGRLLLFFGSGDPGNYTALALEALALLGRSDPPVDVVIGGGNPHRAEIEQRCSRLPQACLHIDAPNMASLMVEADIALGAGGSSTWERACLGLPSIVIAVAENQRELTAAMADQGALVQLPVEGLAPEIVADAINGLAREPERLRKMARISGELVDGHGADRVCRELLARPLQLRLATANDSHDLHRWRNAEEVRRFSKNPEPIALADHERWLADVFADAHRDLLIAEEAGEAVGVLRYDRKGSEAVVSIYLVPGRSGQGLGPRILLEGDRWLNRYHPGIERIHAEVLAGNTASARAFTEAGYEPGPKTFQKRLRT